MEPIYDLIILVLIILNQCHRHFSYFSDKKYVKKNKLHFSQQYILKKEGDFF